MWSQRRSLEAFAATSLIKLTWWIVLTLGTNHMSTLQQNGDCPVRIMMDQAVWDPNRFLVGYVSMWEKKTRLPDCFMLQKSSIHPLSSLHTESLLLKSIKLTFDDCTMTLVDGWLMFMVCIFFLCSSTLSPVMSNEAYTFVRQLLRLNLNCIWIKSSDHLAVKDPNYAKFALPLISNNKCHYFGNYPTPQRISPSIFFIFNHAWLLHWSLIMCHRGKTMFHPEFYF